MGQFAGIWARAAFMGQAFCWQHAAEPQQASPPEDEITPARAEKLTHPKDASKTSASTRRRIDRILTPHEWAHNRLMETWPTLAGAERSSAYQGGVSRENN